MKPNALNRGTAVHLGANQVRFVWACGCTKVDRLGVKGVPLNELEASRLVRNWRQVGVALEQCRKHPKWHSTVNPLARLNAEHPVQCWCRKPPTGDEMPQRRFLSDSQCPVHGVQRYAERTLSGRST